MKEYKKMYVINGCNLSEKEFNFAIDYFNSLYVYPERFQNTPENAVIKNTVSQTVDKFQVDITTYYFNYFGKYIEIGQEIVSRK